MFTIMVGPQRITFMIGAGPQYQFIKAKDEVLDQAPVYGFTIPVFGEGIVYDSPLDERQQQVKLLVHSMNTKGLEAMVPKMIEEAEEYFAAWGNEGEVEVRFWNWDYEDPDGIKFAAEDGGTEITDCEKSFRRYICYLNFPRCDAEKNSLIMCRSVCENYMRACSCLRTFIQ